VLALLALLVQQALPVLLVRMLSEPRALKASPDYKEQQV
jgi:hypothetical protein